MVDIVRNEKNWEAEFENVTYIQANEIAKEDNIKEISIYRKLGTSYIDLNFDIGTTQLDVRAYDENTLKNSNVVLRMGRLPKNSNEIVISSMENMRTIIEDNISLNQTLTLNINGKTKEYLVVGMAESLEFDSTKSFSLINIGAITYLDDELIDEEAIVNVSILTKNIQKIYQTTENIQKNLGLEVEKNVFSNSNSIENTDSSREDEETWLRNILNPNVESDAESIDNSFNIIYNTKLLNYACVLGSGSDFVKTLIKVVIFVISVIMIVSIMVIYTAFKMTYSERIKEFGMLLSLGASKKELRQIIRKEAFILGTIGVAIGMGLGFVLSTIIIKILNTFISKITDSKYLLILIDNQISMTLNFPFIIVLFAIIIVYTIVLISCKLPMMKASKANIIESIKNIADIKCKSKQLKYPRIVEKIFSEEGKIGYKNIKRDKIRYRTIVVSIIISITLFLSVSGYISNIYSTETEDSQYDDYKMEIMSVSLINDNCIKDVINYIEYNNLANDYYISEIFLTSDTMILEESKVSDTIKQMIKDKAITQDLYGNGYFNIGLQPLKFSDNLYNYLLDKVEVNSLKDNEIIIVNTINKETKYGDEIRITNLNVGENVTINLNGGKNETFKIARNIR